MPSARMKQWVGHDRDVRRSDLPPDRRRDRVVVDLRCGRIAPFGFPVLPDVYSSMAAASASASTWATLPYESVAASSDAASRSSSNHRTDTSLAAIAASPSDRNRSSPTIITGAASPITRASSATERRQLSGTSTAPTRIAPKNSAIASTRLPVSVAMRSPRFTSSDASARTHRSALAFTSPYVCLPPRVRSTIATRSGATRAHQAMRSDVDGNDGSCVTDGWR